MSTNSPSHHSTKSTSSSNSSQSFKLPKFDQKQAIKVVLGTTCVVVIMCMLSLLHQATTTLPPGTRIGEIPVGGLTIEQAIVSIESQYVPPEFIVLSTDVVTLASSSALSAFKPEVKTSIEQTIPTEILSRLMWYLEGLRSPHQLILTYSFHAEPLVSQFQELAQMVEVPSNDPSVSLGRTNQAQTLQINSGSLGRSLASSQLEVALDQLRAGNTSIVLATTTTGRVLTSEEVEMTTQLAHKLVGSSLVIKAERSEIVVPDTTLVTLLNPPGELDQDRAQKLIAEWQTAIGNAPQNPELILSEDGTSVLTFKPPRNGRTIQEKSTLDRLSESWQQLAVAEKRTQIVIELPLEEVPPQINLADLNNLGIRERIGFGESKYAHSISNRIHNVAITTQRINNSLIPPGAEFSFNKTLGDVSTNTGYRTAYIIKNGKTELGDGGGVCQVSTTLFRSVLDAGLEVTKRLPHSYRVTYYELDNKPGLDATVYTGETDFRFINDTDNHILIHAVADSSNTYMYVELYGTSDGRTTRISEHVTWDARKAPPPEYFPDPSLPSGKTVQIDWATPGIRAKVVNEIYNADGTLKRADTYLSNYKPWSAKYLQGTGG